MWPRRYTHKIERDVVRARRPWRCGWYLASSARRRSGRLRRPYQVLSPRELQPEPCYLPLPCWSPSLLLGFANLQALRTFLSTCGCARHAVCFGSCGAVDRAAQLSCVQIRGRRCAAPLHVPRVCDASTPDAIAWCIALRWMPGLRRLLIRYEGHFSDGTLSRRRFDSPQTVFSHSISLPILISLSLFLKSDLNKHTQLCRFLSRPSRVRPSPSMSSLPTPSTT